MGEDIKNENQEEVLEEPFIDPEEDARVQAENKRAHLNKLKNKIISELVVDINNIPFAADDQSQNRLSATGTIANWLFNKALGDTFTQLAQDPKLDAGTKAMFGGLGNVITQIYSKVYEQTEIGWKGADDKIHLVHGEDVLNALYMSMQKVGEIIHKAETGELTTDDEDV